MKYLLIIFAIMTLTACNLSESVTVTPSPAQSSQPTSAPPPAVNEVLSITPTVRTAESGQVILAPGETVVVRWDGLPDGSTATFTLGNFLVDGGVIPIGQGTSASFTVPDRIEGEITAVANLPSGITVEAIRIPIATENMISGNCNYIPPALGPGVSLYSEADMNTNPIGDVIYDAEYVVLASQTGVDNKGETRTFYQIQQIGTETVGWVPSNVGENLGGECTPFQ